jgi:hypothetical protein
MHKLAAVCWSSSSSFVDNASSKAFSADKREGEEEKLTER